MLSSREQNKAGIGEYGSERGQGQDRARAKGTEGERELGQEGAGMTETSSESVGKSVKTHFVMCKNNGFLTVSTKRAIPSVSQGPMTKTVVLCRDVMLLFPL